MRLLSPLGLVDRAAYLVVFPLEDRLFLGPHGQDHLDGLAQMPQAVSSVGKVVAIGAVLLLVPPGPDATDESPMREHIDRARHFCEQGGMAIAVAGDRLTNADAPGVTRNGCCGDPALERRLARASRTRMKVITEPSRRKT